MTNTTKHTPGPWYIQGDPDGQRDDGSWKHELHKNRFITSGGCQIGSPEWELEKNNEIVCEMTDSRFQKANAQLIAASPELLEACKAAVKYIDHNWQKNAAPVLDILDIEIAKASGRE
jgi:hypothetical protein